MRYVIIMAILGICSFAWADIYVVIDEQTNEVRGTADVRPDYIGNWEKNYTMIKGDEIYRGKQPYEIKYEDGKLRFATQQEIDEYKKSLLKPQLSENEIIKLKELVK